MSSILLLWVLEGSSLGEAFFGFRLNFQTKFETKFNQTENLLILSCWPMRVVVENFLLFTKLACIWPLLLLPLWSQNRRRTAIRVFHISQGRMTGTMARKSAKFGDYLRKLIFYRISCDTEKANWQNRRKWRWPEKSKHFKHSKMHNIDWLESTDWGRLDWLSNLLALSCWVANEVVVMIQSTLHSDWSTGEICKRWNLKSNWILIRSRWSNVEDADEAHYFTIYSNLSN